MSVMPRKEVVVVRKERLRCRGSSVLLHHGRAPWLQEHICIETIVRRASKKHNNSSLVSATTVTHEQSSLGLFVTHIILNSTSTIITDTNMPEPLHDANVSRVQIELHDYEDLKSTKAQLDKARQEVERRYEDLSNCCLDNMTYAKAQLDQARQVEQKRYENFERVHSRLVDSMARFIAAEGSTAPHSTDELGGDDDTSLLGPLPSVKPRRIRAPTRASTGPSRRATRQTRARGTATPPVRQSRDPVILLLASRASENAELKALMRIVATGNASQEQFHIFDRHIAELKARLNADQTQSTVQIKSEHVE